MLKVVYLQQLPFWKLNINYRLTISLEITYDALLN